MTQTETYDQLVARAQQAQGEERHDAFNELIQRFEEAGLSWAYQRLHEREAAEDALQEASLKAFLHLDQLQEAKAFPAWFKQIVLHTCHRMLRQERADISLHGYDETQPDPSDEVEQGEQHEDVNEAVLRLPEHERVVTQLFYYGDYSQNEIAVTLAVPLTTVKKRLQYAREHLKGLIGSNVISLLPGYSYTFNGGCTAAAFQLDNYVPDLLLEWTPSVQNEMESGIVCAY